VLFRSVFLIDNNIVALMNTLNNINVKKHLKVVEYKEVWTEDAGKLLRFTARTFI